MREKHQVEITANSANLTDTALYTALSKKTAAVFYVSDAIRPGAKVAIHPLPDMLVFSSINF